MNAEQQRLADTIQCVHNTESYFAALSETDERVYIEEFLVVAVRALLAARVVANTVAAKEASA
jgi:hypothetical protein